MKKLVLCLVSLMFVSCATTSNNTIPLTPPEQNQKFVAFVKVSQGMLAVGGQAALTYAVSSEDRAQIKALLSGSGHVFESLENGDIPDEGDIHDALEAYFPTTSEKYEAIAKLASTAWAYILPIINQYVPNNDQVMIARYVNYVLKALAQTSYQVGGS